MNRKRRIAFLVMTVILWAGAGVMILTQHHSSREEESALPSKAGVREEDQLPLCHLTTWTKLGATRGEDENAVAAAFHAQRERSVEFA